MFFTTVKLSFFLLDIRDSVFLIKQEWLYIINASFIIDMFISLKTGIYKKGNIVEDGK
jgi:hypothetical protein